MEPPRPRTPPRQRAMLVNERSRDTRLALIRAARHLWAGEDFTGAFETTTPADIARAAGVSRGTFYFHFANKDQLLLEMGAESSELMAQEVDKGIADGVALPVLVESVLSSMARRVGRTPKAAAVRSGALGVQARLTEKIVPGARGTGPAFEALVRYGRDRGELAAATDVADAAAMLHTITMDGIMRWGVGNHSATWLRQTLCRRATIVLRGLAPDVAAPAPRRGGTK